MGMFHNHSTYVLNVSLRSTNIPWPASDGFSIEPNNGPNPRAVANPQIRLIMSGTQVRLQWDFPSEVLIGGHYASYAPVVVSFVIVLLSNGDQRLISGCSVARITDPLRTHSQILAVEHRRHRCEDGISGGRKPLNLT